MRYIVEHGHTTGSRHDDLVLRVLCLEAGSRGSPRCRSRRWHRSVAGGLDRPADVVGRSPTRRRRRRPSVAALRVDDDHAVGVLGAEACGDLLRGVKRRCTEQMPRSTGSLVRSSSSSAHVPPGGLRGVPHRHLVEAVRPSPSRCCGRGAGRGRTTARAGRARSAHSSTVRALVDVQTMPRRGGRTKALSAAAGVHVGDGDGRDEDRRRHGRPCRRRPSASCSQALLDLIDVGHVGHRAAGGEVGGRITGWSGRGSRSGGLGHEMDAAEHDRLGVRAALAQRSRAGTSRPRSRRAARPPRAGRSGRGSTTRVTERCLGGADASVELVVGRIAVLGAGSSPCGVIRPGSTSPIDEAGPYPGRVSNSQGPAARSVLQVLSGGRPVVISLDLGGSTDGSGSVTVVMRDLLDLPGWRGARGLRAPCPGCSGRAAQDGGCPCGKLSVGMRLLGALRLPSEVGRVEAAPRGSSRRPTAQLGQCELVGEQAVRDSAVADSHCATARAHTRRCGCGRRRVGAGPPRRTAPCSRSSPAAASSRRSNAQ